VHVVSPSVRRGPKGRESIASGFTLGNLFYRAGERREGKEGTEGIFYHRDTESTEFRNKKNRDLKIKDTSGSRFTSASVNARLTHGDRKDHEDWIIQAK
jgi:hypothetical protein